MDGRYIGNRPCKLAKSTSERRDAGVSVVLPNRPLKTTGLRLPGKRRHINTL